MNGISGTAESVCPECGGTPTVRPFKQGDCTLYRVECPRCGARIIGFTESTATNNWNRKVTQ